MRILLLTLLTFTAASADWGTPTTEPLSETIRGHTGREMLAITPDGLLHAIWMQARTDTNGQMIVHRAQTADGSWSVADTVNPPEHFVIGDAALAVSPVTGIPFVAYGTASGLFLAMNDPTLGWMAQLLGQAADYYCCPTLEIDRNGIPQIAWINYWPDLNEYHIAYYYVVWSEDIQHLMNTQLGPFGGGAFPKLTTDDEYRAHIAFRGVGGADYEIHYIHNNSAGGEQWTSTVLTTPNQDDYSCDLFFQPGGGLFAPISGNDGFGFPGQVYLKQTDTDGNWTLPELVCDAESAVDAVLAVAADFSAQIISSQTSGNILTGNIIASFWDDDGWAVADITDNTWYPAFVIDLENYGHILCTQEDDLGNARILHLKSEFPLSGDVISLEVTPAVLNFPDTQVGDSSAIQFTVLNTSSITLAVLAGDQEGPFTCPWGVITNLAPGAWMSIPGIFTPLAAGEYVDTIFIRTMNTDYVFPLPCTGNTTGDFAALEATPTFHDYGRVQVPESESFDFTVRNTGTIPLTVISEFHEPPFVDTWEVPILLQPREETSWTIWFDAIGVGVFTDSLICISDAEVSATVHVRGEGFTLAADPSQSTLPREFSVAAYPNPFNPTTEITIDLPTAAPLYVTVYNSLGEVMQTLADSPFPAGSHRIHFDGSDFSTGIYFVQATAGAQARVVKAVLMK
jgi:hypothetical protein